MTTASAPLAGHSTVDDFETRIADAGIRGFWSMLDEYEMSEPANPEIGCIWSHDTYRALALEALSLIPVEKADRRNLFFSNPGLKDAGAATSRLLAGVQAINPGETSRVHRHTAAAARVHLEGAGGYTTVAGRKCQLEFGDVILNPNGLWHETGNDGDEPVIWMDVLDLKLTRALHANFFTNDYAETNAEGAAVPRRQQTVVAIDDPERGSSQRSDGQAPGLASTDPTTEFPPLLHRYRLVRPLLDELPSADRLPWDGTDLELTHPDAKASVLQTIDARMHLLRAGHDTLPSRRTAGTVYCCLEGSGRTVVNGCNLQWSERDIFVVPGWAWMSHHPGDRDCILYAVSDAPMMQRLGLFVEDRQDDDGNISREIDWDRP